MAGCPLYTRATVVCAGRILSVAGTGRHGNAFLRWRSASPRWWRSVTRTSAFLSLLPSISVHFIFQGTEQHLLYLCRKVTYLFKKQRAAIGFLPKPCFLLSICIHELLKWFTHPFCAFMSLASAALRISFMSACVVVASFSSVCCLLPKANRVIG